MRDKEVALVYHNIARGVKHFVIVVAKNYFCRRRQSLPQAFGEFGKAFPHRSDEHSRHEMAKARTGETWPGGRGGKFFFLVSFFRGFVIMRFGRRQSSLCSLRSFAAIRLANVLPRKTARITKDRPHGTAGFACNAAGLNL